MIAQEIPVGLCQCGCGAWTPIGAYTDRRRGQTKGEPTRFLPGHNSRQGRGLLERIAQMSALAADLSPDGWTGCIVWTGATAKGYGQINVGGKYLRAHRVAWLASGREIPVGQVLDHRCQRRVCINVDHLEPVTNTENVRRGASTKLTIEQAVEVRSLATAGWRQRDIAVAYGVGPSMVSSIARGANWADAA